MNNQMTKSFLFLWMGSNVFPFRRQNRKKKNTKTWIDTPVDFMQLYGMKFCSDFYIKF